MFEKFSDSSRRAIVIADADVRRLGGGVIGDVELLLGMIAEGSGIAASALRSLGVDLSMLQLQLEQGIQPLKAGSSPEKLTRSPELLLARDSAIEIAQTMGHDVIGTHHFLPGLLAHPDFKSARVLAANGVSFESAKAAVLQVLKSGQAEAASPYGGSKRQSR